MLGWVMVTTKQFKGNSSSSVLTEPFTQSTFSLHCIEAMFMFNVAVRQTKKLDVKVDFADIDFYPLLLVGEPITVPKVEEPTRVMVELYHAMYIKSLRSLFDKYKTRFGLKESDILHIQ